ncbi:hypothetical protein M0R45_017280 [Rubus argutus]|uniref:Uncharacterized protein n=1 Tax=Rubus argutus TaxID=59490 RepID=A0AAW1XVF6_RUBAR
MALNVSVLESTVVRPAVETPRQSLWISNIDMVQPHTHTPLVYFYKQPNNNDGADKDQNFFDKHVLKHSLSKALVPFYPLAGRLKQKGTSMVSISIAMQRITYLKCGGVALGLRLDHRVADGLSAFHFINTWSDMARGLDCAIPPTMDRTILRARDPPRPLLDHNHHIEYPPRNQHEINTEATTVSIFRFTREQINVLKAMSTTTKEEDDDDMNNYTSFEVLAERQQQLWQGISYQNQYGMLQAVFHNALVRMDDDYLRSSVDHLELQQRRQDLSALAHGTHVRFPNLGINSWSILPLYDSDFGWGRPIFVGGSGIRREGKAYMVPSETNDGSILLSISLQSQHMKSFSNLVYDI